MNALAPIAGLSQPQRLGGVQAEHGGANVGRGAAGGRDRARHHHGESEQHRPGGRLGGQRLRPALQASTLPRCRSSSSAGMQGYQLYMVVKGDTLTKIASELGSTVEKISAANRQSDPNKIRIGQILRVPV